jgi:methyl-accepting chemotaxis protein
MEMTNETLLITGISALSGVIVGLALYVRKLHNQSLKTMKETQEVILKVVEKNTDAYHEMKTSIMMNTEATKNGAETMRGAVDRLTNQLDKPSRNHDTR